MGKIGRNDPCPCGSGKKFKYCHIAKEDEIIGQGLTGIPIELRDKIVSMPNVRYGRSQEILDELELDSLTGRGVGIRFIDLKKYNELGLSGRHDLSEREKGTGGGVVVNPLKTRDVDPDNIYVAISRNIGDSALIHQVAHVLDYLAGSGLMPGLAKPLSYDLGIPAEHLEHPSEFGYWLDFLARRFGVQLDADDAIISYLYQNGLLIKGEHIENKKEALLKVESEKILKFLSEKSVEIDNLICERPGYIGSRIGEG